MSGEDTTDLKPKKKTAKKKTLRRKKATKKKVAKKLHAVRCKDSHRLVWSSAKQYWGERFLRVAHLTEDGPGGIIFGSLNSVEKYVRGLKFPFEAEIVELDLIPVRSISSDEDELNSYLEEAEHRDRRGS